MQVTFNCIFSIVFAAVFSCVCPVSSGELWWLALTDEPSSTSPSTLICCECVQYYKCINDTIVTDGTGLIDIRFRAPTKVTVNVRLCPTFLDVCCTVPDAPDECEDFDFGEVVTTKDPIYITPHPEAYCECIMHYDCAPDLVVDNGGGKTSLELINGRKVSHSKCMHSMEVCCYQFSPDYAAEGNGSSENPLGKSIGDQDEATTERLQEDETCECVQPIMCGADGYIITDGSFSLDARMGYQVQKTCPYDKTLVCCKPPIDQIETTVESSTVEESNRGPSPIEPLTIEPPAMKPPTMEPSTVINTVKDFKRILNESSTTPVPSLVAPKCGVRNSKGYAARIVGFKGGESQFGEFPWVAALLRKETIDKIEYPVFVGGASLINRRIVITTAHKVKKTKVSREKLLVRLGEWDTSSIREIHIHFDTQVERIIVHPEFNPVTLNYDVAILLLKEIVPLAFHIRPICMATSVTQVDPKKCVINGWGKDAYDEGRHQQILKNIEVPLLPHYFCQNLLRKTRLSRFFRLHRSFICAGGEEGKDACVGDGGGPLACKKLDSDEDEYLQVGMTAWGIGCGEKDVPGVYVDVTVVRPWIEKEMEKLLEVKSENGTTPSSILGERSTTVTTTSTRRARRLPNMKSGKISTTKKINEEAEKHDKTSDTIDKIRKEANKHKETSAKNDKINEEADKINDKIDKIRKETNKNKETSAKKDKINEEIGKKSAEKNTKTLYQKWKERRMKQRRKSLKKRLHIIEEKIIKSGLNQD